MDSEYFYDFNPENTATNIQTSYASKILALSNENHDFSIRVERNNYGNRFIHQTYILLLLNSYIRH